MKFISINKRVCINRLFVILSFILSLMTCFALNAAARTEDSPQSISAAEELQVITLLNNFCGDSWCEGDYEIDFKSVKFSDPHQIIIEAAATSASSGNSANVTNPIPLNCQIEEPAVILDTLRLNNPEETYLAEQRLYVAVSVCIDSALYAKLPFTN